MKPAAIIAAALVAVWLMSRNSTDKCCPWCSWEADDDEPEC